MIRFELSAETEKLRDEFRSWLLKNPPPKISRESSLDSFIRIGKEWQSKLAADNWIGVHWPKEYGGRSLTLVEEAIVQEELGKHESPQLLGLFGLTMVGPIIVKYGTGEQKKKFLSKILTAEEIWCQGFSESEAGSDLSAIKTKGQAIIDPKLGKGFLVTGSKIWTSFAQVANWCFLLCRTSEAKNTRYEGFSYILVDMKSAGITIRPLKQITGDAEFNEVFFDKVFVPESNLVGEEGKGWGIAISTLMYERVILTFARQLQSENLINKLNYIFKNESQRLTETDQREFSKCIAQHCAVRALSYEHLVKYANGETPGPEGSMDKLGWTDSFQSLCKLALKINPEKYLSEEHNSDVYRYLYSRGRSIAAGTSEIQRNIIAERILGLEKARR